MAIEDLPQALSIAGSILIGETTNEARLACARESGATRVQWSALLEGGTCPLCAALDGKVFEVGETLFDPPAHINCRCLWIERDADEAGPVDWFDPGAPGSADEDRWTGLIGKHGHFLHDEATYSPLRIPSAPDGNDFVFRRRRNPETGELESVLEWARPRYELPGLDEATQQTGVKETGRRWEAHRTGRQADIGGGLGRPRFESDDERYPLPPIDRQVPPELAILETTEEVQAWASERWPEVEFDLAGAQPETIKPTLAELDRLEREWPGTTAAFRRIHVDQTLAADEIAVSHTGELALGSIHFGDWEFYRFRVVRMAEEGVYHSGSGSFAETMAHEFGHQWSYTIMDSDDQEAKGLLTDWMRRHRDARWTYNVAEDPTANEALAEAFAMRYHEAQEASEPAVQEFWQLMDRLRDRGF